MDRSNLQKTVLGADCELSGELTLDNDALIMGVFEGRLCVSGNLDLNRTSRIKGTIVAGSLRVGGRVEADVIVRDKLELLEGGVLLGRVFSPSLTVASGAVIRGQVCIGPNAAAEADRWIDDGQPATKREERIAAPMRKPAAQSQPSAPVHEETDAAPSSPTARTIPASIKAVLERRQPAKPLHTGDASASADLETSHVDQAA